MKNIIKPYLLLCIAILCFSCSSSDDNMEPDPDPDPDPQANPIPGKTTTFTADIKAIVDDQCLRCHTIPLDNGAPFPMRNYQEIINAINEGWDMFGRVSTTNPINVMPPAGRLPQETVTLFLDWEADGVLEQ